MKAAALLLDWIGRKQGPVRDVCRQTGVGTTVFKSFDMLIKGGLLFSTQIKCNGGHSHCSLSQNVQSSERKQFRVQLPHDAADHDSLGSM